MPSPSLRVVFTATIDGRWEAGRGVGAYLKVRRRLHGEVGDRVDATWSGLIWPAEDVGPSDGDVDLGDVIISSCATRSWYNARLSAAPMGAEVAVLARRTPDGIDVLDLALADSPQGQALLDLAHP